MWKCAQKVVFRLGVVKELSCMAILRPRTRAETCVSLGPLRRYRHALPCVLDRLPGFAEALSGERTVGQQCWVTRTQAQSAGVHHLRRLLLAAGHQAVALRFQLLDEDGSV